MALATLALNRFVEVGQTAAELRIRLGKRALRLSRRALKLSRNP